MASIQFGSTSGSRPYCVLTVSQSSQSIADNTSIVSYSLVLKRPSSISSSATKKWSVTVNGTTRSGSGAIGGSGDKTLLSGSITVPHNSDGTKSISFSGSATLEVTWSNGYIGTISGSGSMGLSTIARATTPSLSASGQHFGSGVTIYTPRASGSFTHTLQYNFVNTGWVSFASSVETSFWWTIPNDLMTQIPSSTTSWMTIKCITYNGDSYIGEKTVRCDVYVPDWVVPSISSVGISEAVDGIASQFGGYVKNKSKVYASTNAYGTYGSSIVSYSTNIYGVGTYSGSSFTSGLLINSGTVNIVSTVTDSRGRNASKSTSISVIDYYSPNISSFSVERCASDGTLNDDGVYVKCVFAYSIAPINSKNNKYIRLQYLNESIWTDINTWSDAYSATKTYITSKTFSADSSYLLRVYINEYFTEVALEKTLKTAFSLMNYNPSGHGLAIGQISTSNTFEVGLPAKFDKEVSINHLTIDGGNVLKIGPWWTHNSGQNVDTLTNEINFVYTSHGAPTTGVILTASCYTNTNYRMQIMAEYTSSAFFFRSRNGDSGTWKPWKRLANSDDVMSPSNHDHTYSTWLGFQLSSGGDWFGWYNGYQGTRRGYIQHDGGSFNIVNEVGGVKLTNNKYVSICWWQDSVNYGGYFTPSARGNSQSCTLGTTDYPWHRAYVYYSEYVVSDERSKRDIVAIKNIHNRTRSAADENIYERFFHLLTPTIYKMNDRIEEENRKNRFGFIAQDIARAFENLKLDVNNFGLIEHSFFKNDDGEEEDKYVLCYQEFIVLNTHMIQKLYKKVDTQQKQIDDLTKQVQELTELVLNLNKNK